MRSFIIKLQRLPETEVQRTQCSVVSGHQHFGGACYDLLHGRRKRDGSWSCRKGTGGKAEESGRGEVIDWSSWVP